MTLKEEFENELVIMGFTGEKNIYTNDFGRIYINWLETKLISLSQHDVSNRREQLIAFANYCEREWNCTEVPIDVIDEYLESN